MAISTSNKTSAATTGSAAGALNSPFGGKLVDLIVSEERAAEMKATAKDLGSLTLEERPLCDLELLAVGGFSPLATFLKKADYERVVGEKPALGRNALAVADCVAGGAR